MHSILVTGGAGFIGSVLVRHLLDTQEDTRIVTLDKLTYAGDIANLRGVENHPRHTFVKGDICDSALLRRLFAEHDIRGVYHLAAESHVDNSISGPEIFFVTNVLGTQKLLDAAYKHWMDGPEKIKAGYEACRFHLTSTDEVYGTLGETGFFTEATPYAPNSPYSASKAGGDFAARSYHRTYGMNITISNCSNNYGPHQHDEKLIPTVIRKALAHEPIPIYGDGKNIRDWLHVHDHCAALVAVYKHGRAGETYNIGSRNECDNNAMATKLCAILDEELPWAGHRYGELISYVADRAGHDRRYAIDPSKAEGELGWQGAVDFEKGLRETVRWYMQKYGRHVA